MNYGNLLVFVVLLAIAAVVVWRFFTRKRSKPAPQEHEAHSPGPGYDKAAIARSAAEGQSHGGNSTD